MSTSTTIELLQRLVAIPSITPQDHGCLKLTLDRLQPLGFQAKWFNSETVSNLWLTHGQGHPVLTFLGHIDVVPTGPYERWHTDPFTPTQKDGFLYGRGSCDMKGGVAAMVEACAQFVQTTPQHHGTLALLLTSDEEGPAIEGTKWVLEQLLEKGQTFDYGIVGEPTCAKQFGDVIKTGRRGSLSAHLKIIGKQGHVAYPHKARNAVHSFAAALNELICVEWDQGNAQFPPSTLQISNMHAGTGADNVVPGELMITFNFRYGTASSTESLKQRTEAIFQKHNLEYLIHWTVHAKPYLTTSSHLFNILQDVIKQATGIAPRGETTGGTSDGRFLAEVCQEVLEFGPLNHTIHQVNECVNIADIDTLKNIYQTTIERLLLPSG